MPTYDREFRYIYFHILIPTVQRSKHIKKLFFKFKNSKKNITHLNVRTHQFKIIILPLSLAYFKTHTITHLFERQARRVSQIAAFSLKHRMWFIPNDEYNIRWYLAGRLVAFLLKCNLRTGFPARFNRYAHIFVLLP